MEPQLQGEELYKYQEERGVKKEMTHSTPPTSASGKWCYTPFIKDSRTVDDTMFMDAYTKDPPDEWTGTFVGNSVDVYLAVILSTGAWDAAGVALFDGAVGNKKGALVIWFSGNRPDAEADWSGKWVILRGTGGLAFGLPLVTVAPSSYGSATTRAETLALISTLLRGSISPGPSGRRSSPWTS